eukprot:m.365317 g.365317  ORF g.365317 m.365317 type:complete len:637 (-) comp30915_c0_seq1:62-1972(-)
MATDSELEEIAQFLVRALKEEGGYLPATQLFSKLYASRPELKAKVKASQFIRERKEFQWVDEGTGAVLLVKSAPLTITSSTTAASTQPEHTLYNLPQHVQQLLGEPVFGTQSPRTYVGIAFGEDDSGQRLVAVAWHNQTIVINVSEMGEGLVPVFQRLLGSLPSTSIKVLFNCSAFLPFIPSAMLQTQTTCADILDLQLAYEAQLLLAGGEARPFAHSLSEFRKHCNKPLPVDEQRFDRSVGIAARTCIEVVAELSVSQYWTRLFASMVNHSSQMLSQYIAQGDVQPAQPVLLSSVPPHRLVLLSAANVLPTPPALPHIPYVKGKVHCDPIHSVVTALGLVLPPNSQASIACIALDVGAVPALFDTHQAKYSLSDTRLTLEQLNGFLDTLDKWTDDVYAVPNTLHYARVSRDLRGQPSTVTLHCNFHITNLLYPVLDVVTSCHNILFLGNILSKTIALSLLRQAADYLSPSEHVLVVDTHNELGGYSSPPHSSLGTARRLMVKHPSEQPAVIAEALEKHHPTVLIVASLSLECVPILRTALTTTRILSSIPFLSFEEAARSKKHMALFTSPGVPPLFDAMVEVMSDTQYNVVMDTATAVKHIGKAPGPIHPYTHQERFVPATADQQQLMSIRCVKS